MTKKRRAIGLHTLLPLTLALSFTALIPSMSQAQVNVPPAEDVVPTGALPREETYETPRGIGMAGGRATAVGTSAMAYNAANLPLAPVYHIETMLSFIANQNTWMYGGAILDAVTSRLAMGLSWYGFHGNDDRNYSGYDGRLSLGMALGQSFGIGLSGRYINFSSRAEDENGESVGPGINTFTMDASLRVTVFEGLNIAALGYNLIQTNSPIAPFMVGGSIGYSYEQVLSLSVDMLADLSTFEGPELVFGAGAEYLAAGSVPLRLGFRRDFGRDLNQFTASVGYVTQKYGLDIALRQGVGSPQSDTQLMVGFRYHVQ